MLLSKDALKLTRQGVPVFRIERGTKDRFIDTDWNRGAATADLVTNLQRFSGQAFNVGVWCGAGLLVIDIDAHHGGLEAWDALVQEIGPVPETFTVRTPNGGLHLYFNRGRERFGQAQLVKDKIDVRADGGYVVGPGSEFNGRPYVVEKELPIAALPDNLRARLRASTKTDAPVQVVSDLDTPANLERAELYLAKWAPTSDEGGRNNTLFKVVCQLGDLGLSEEMALEFAQRWNATHCRPPLDVGEVEHTTRSAYVSRTAPIGRDAPGLGFTPVHAGPAPTAASIAATLAASLPVKWFDQDAHTRLEVEPRQWILYRRLIRKFVTGIIAPGGTGKSMLSIQWAAVIATNDAREHRLDVREPTKVLILNNEDPLDELERRAHAVFKGLGFDWVAARNRIGFLSGYDEPYVFVEKKQGQITQTPHVDAMIQYILDNGIGVLIVDPLISTHSGLNENDNADMNALISAYRKIASRTGCAILAIHHARKPASGSSDGHVGNIDAGRGASAIKDAMRIGLTFFNMSEDDAERYGIQPEHKHKYVRLDETEKFNLGLRNVVPEWFERKSIDVQLKDGKSESMGYLLPVKLQEQDPDAALIAEVVNCIGQHVDLSGKPITVTAAARALNEAKIIKGRVSDKVIPLVRKFFEVPRQYGPRTLIMLPDGIGFSS